MKYSFPITANLRALLPSVEQAFSSVEGHFKDFTGESLKMSCQAPIMTFEVNTTVALNSDQVKLLHASLMPLLIKQFPNCNIEIGEPKIINVPAFDNYRFNAAHQVASQIIERQERQDDAGYDVNEQGERIDSDHNMFLSQDLAALYGRCEECEEPLHADGICPSGCKHSEV